MESASNPAHDLRPYPVYEGEVAFPLAKAVELGRRLAALQEPAAGAWPQSAIRHEESGTAPRHPEDIPAIPFCSIAQSHSIHFGFDLSKIYDLICD